MKIQKNTIYNNFILSEKKYSKDIDSTFYTFTHQKLGTELIFIQNKDKEKAFTVSFKTPSPDSKGYQHILEHSVLRSSKKYNFGNKETFAELLKKSMPVFLNAATYPDKTVYPFSTMLESEFFKIMDIYIDAVLHPLVLENENFFRQEGWRWDKDKKGKYFINGVVFNEMKGRLSSPEVLAEKNMMDALFPDSEYRQESGGDPDIISDLQYRDLVSYHKKYYHPSNATFLIYGDVNISKVLKKIDNDFLQNFTKGKRAQKTKIQKKIKETKNKKYFFPSAVSEKSSFLNIAYMGESAKKVNENFTLALVQAIIFNQKSPLYKKLIESSLLSNITNYYERDVLQNYFTILFSGINSKDSKKIQNILDRELLKMVKEGVDEKLVDEVLNNFEYSMERKKYSTGKGLNIIDEILRMKNHGLEFYNVFEYKKKIKYFKEKIKEDGLEKLIKKYFIDNKHKGVLLLEAKKDFNPYKKLTKKIEKINKVKNKKVLEKIDKKIEEFKKYQNSENLNNIDELILPPKEKDLPKKIRKYKVSDDNKKYFFKRIVSKNISACDIFFDKNTVPVKDIAYLKFFLDVLKRLSPEGSENNLFVKELETITASYRFSSTLYSSKNGNIENRVSLHLAYLNKNEDKIFAMLSRLFKKIQFEKSIFLEEVKKEIEAMKNSFASSGHFFSTMRALSKVHELSKLREKTEGIEYYTFLKKVEKEMENDFEGFEEKMKNISEKVFTKNKILVAHTAAKKNKNILKKLDIKNKKVKYFSYTIALEKENEAVIFDGLENSFNSVGVSLGKTKLSLDKMTALSGFLSYDYLWEKVREEGGAYGSGLQLDFAEEKMSTYSYMDSRISGTYGDYYSIGKYLKKLELTDIQKDGIIAKSLNVFIQPESEFSEASHCLWRELKGLSIKRLEKVMKEIKSFSKNDFQNMAEDVEKYLKNGSRVTFTNSQKIKKDKKLFDVITIID